MLDFEGSWWLHPGPKELSIREQLGMSATRYYQILSRLIDDPNSMAHDPLTVRRLRRIRDDRRRSRVAGRLASGPSGEGSQDS